MTIKFNDKISYLIANRGLLVGLRPTASNDTAYQTSDPVAITVYSGTQPLAQDLIDSWEFYNTNYLIHFRDVVWEQPNTCTQKYITISGFPSPTIPSITGTGEWCIVWSGNPDIIALSSTSIPITKFILGPVSGPGGSGIVRFDPEPVFNVSTPASIYDGVISVSST